LRFEQIHEKMNKYREGRAAIPKDSDGLYLIVGGQAKINNRYTDG